jgi:hypothetical protein
MSLELSRTDRGRLADWIVIVGSLVAGLALAWPLSRVLPLALIDFQHYYQASRLIWQGENPYGSIEFFAPPWLAVFLAPFLLLPIKFASAVWVMICLMSVGMTALLSEQWLGVPRRPVARLTVLALLMLTPAALFVYITGQLSAIVALGALVAGSEIVRRGPPVRPWLIAVGLALTTVKPNIIWLPGLLIALEVLRRRDWPTVATCAGLIALLAALSFVWVPNWPVSLLAAWQGGAYRGGAGLVAAGYVGLPELGVPVWVFAPLLLYVFWHWWQTGLSLRVLALAFSVCLLVTPYSRSYDHVILIFPSIACLAAPGGITRRLAIALMIAAWLAPLLTLAVLAPVFTSLALLGAFPALRRATGLASITVPSA